MDKYDIAVIGGGPGGYPAAIRAAQMGASVILIEKEALGGTCLNWGCIPTKTLIGSAALYARLQNPPPGLKIKDISFDYREMVNNKNRVVTALRNGITLLLKANGVHFSAANAAFTGRNRLLLQDPAGKESRVEAKYIIIATGCSSAMPSFLPPSEKIIASRAFLELENLPPRLIVIGGGVIGCELACLAARFGTEVTIVEILDDILATVDRDLRAEVRKSMEKKLNIKILTGQPLENISAGRDTVKGQCSGQAIEAELMLCAAGRIPASANLALENCGIKTNKNGCIETDSSFRTAAANIFAIGDVNGKYQLAHAATAQGITAVEAIFTPGRRAKAPLIPACIFTAPEIGTVGLSEQEAARDKRNVIVSKFPFAALGKAVASGETAGFVKWIADPASGQLLGAGAVGAHAAELTAEATLAIQAELTHEELAQTVHAHPTFSEAWMEAAHAVSGHCIHMPPRRKAEL